MNTGKGSRKPPESMLSAPSGTILPAVEWTRWVSTTSLGYHCRILCDHQNGRTCGYVVVEGDERRHDLELLHSLGICNKFDKHEHQRRRRHMKSRMI